MRHDKLGRELTLILLLTENRDYTVQQLCEKLDISRRNLYYYLDFLRDYGFVLEKRGTSYRISRDSAFFKKLFKTLHFTEDEAVAMRRLLDGAPEGDTFLQNLKRKFDRFYDFRILNDIEVHRQYSQNISNLYDAIKFKNKVILRNYSSPHSNTVSNRVVEPFMFLNNNSEIRCYEITSGANKTFKVARMESVMPLHDPWEHEREHKRIYTDIFMFSGEQTMPVKLRLGRLAYNILIEEYPAAIPFVSPDGPHHWLLDTEVCSYVGITRFVLGMMESIEILETPGFIEHIRQQVCSMAAKLGR